MIMLAYAGTADGMPTVKFVPASRNKPIYTENGERVDLSKFDTFLISGDSLHKAGLKSGTYVYTLQPKDFNLRNIPGKFIIFRYDVERQKKEHPDVDISSDSLKARKAELIIDTKLSETDFRKEMSLRIIEDDEFMNKDEVLSSLWRKYKFASDFYSNKDNLIVSMTYKQGKRKTYSFHSPDFLVGIVEYKSVNQIDA